MYDYFVNHRKIKLTVSGEMPCLNVGKPKRPTYIPVEVCPLPRLCLEFVLVSLSK